MNKLYEKLKNRPFFIIGPCVIENYELLNVVAKELVRLKKKYDIEIIFKSSFDKANRTSITSYRGMEINKGLTLLEVIKEIHNLPIITDVHETWHINKVKHVVDIIQIPAFLCRQTDLLLKAAETDKIINIKKAQFLSGEDMEHVIKKITLKKNHNILLTERGTMFGYNNLIVDFRNIPTMKQFGYPVVMDCTHSVQRPGNLNGKTGGNREYILPMALAAKAFGADGYFIETHPEPDVALSDGPNMLHLKNLDELINKILS
jgi:2-dehydro-3-deoxyphosphooctonate aldolase (KDO 8-P synthase)